MRSLPPPHNTRCTPGPPPGSDARRVAGRPLRRMVPPGPDRHLRHRETIHLRQRSARSPHHQCRAEVRRSVGVCRRAASCRADRPCRRARGQGTSPGSRTRPASWTRPASPIRTGSRPESVSQAPLSTGKSDPTFTRNLPRGPHPSSSPPPPIAASPTVESTPHRHCRPSPERNYPRPARGSPGGTDHQKQPPSHPRPRHRVRVRTRCRLQPACIARQRHSDGITTNSSSLSDIRRA
jgi:hypothetical protein